MFAATVLSGNSNSNIVVKLYSLQTPECRARLEARCALAACLASHSAIAPTYMPNKDGSIITDVPEGTISSTAYCAVVMQRLPGVALHSIAQHTAGNHSLLMQRSTKSMAHVPLAQAAKGTTHADDWFNIAAACAHGTVQPLGAFQAEVTDTGVGLFNSDPPAPSPENLEHLEQAIGSWCLHFPHGVATADVTDLTAAEGPCTPFASHTCTARLPTHFSVGFWDLGQPQHAVEAMEYLHRGLSGSQGYTRDLLVALTRGMQLWQNAVPQLQSCRPGWIHGDLNDCNILVEKRDSADSTLHVTGIIDVDDASYSAVVCDCAVLAAYAAMGCAHPVEMMTAVAAGWHSAAPLLAEEVALLPVLVFARCVQSAVASTVRTLVQGVCDESYLRLHMQQAVQLMLELLPLLDDTGLSGHALCGLQQHLLAATGFGLHIAPAADPIASCAAPKALTGLQQVAMDGGIVHFDLPPWGQVCSATPTPTPCSCAPDCPAGQMCVWTNAPAPRRAVASTDEDESLPSTGSYIQSGALRPFPVCAYSLNASTTVALDFSGGSPVDWSSMVGFSGDKIAAFHKCVSDMVYSAGKTVAWGRYGENRVIYDSPHFTATSPSSGAPEAGAAVCLSESRTLHLGVDLFLPEHSPIFAPCDGTLHSFAVNGAPLDYGTAVILQHAPVKAIRQGGDLESQSGCYSECSWSHQTWYSLYGHLSPRTFQMWCHLAPAAHSTGEQGNGEVQLVQPVPVRRGQLIGWVGGPPTNGGWAPHLHFQIMSEDPTQHGKTGDFAGVCKPSEWEAKYAKLVPDPRLLLDPAQMVEL